MMKNKHGFLPIFIVMSLYMKPLVSTAVVSENVEPSSSMEIQKPVNCPKSSMNLEFEQENISQPNDPKSILEIERLSKMVSELQSNDKEMKTKMAKLTGRVSRLESSTHFKEEHYSTESEHRNKRQISNTKSNLRPACIMKACAFDYSANTSIILRPACTTKACAFDYVQENWAKPTIPTSCKDLQEMGHVLNGFHPILSEGKIQLVICNFKSPQVSGMQTPVGFMDIKSSPVYFYFQKSNIRYSVYNVPMPFEIMKLNVGNAMNMTTGIFSAPKAGIYYFAYNGIKDAYAEATDLFLQMNGNKTAVAHATNTGGGMAMAVHATLKLQAGDKISLVLNRGVVHDFFDNYSSFVGFLLEEHDFVM